MILGVGIDLMDVERFCSPLWDRAYRRFFSLHEQRDIEMAGKDRYRAMASRFAAKEALGKALGTGIGTFELNTISVVKDKNGKPHLEISGKAKEKADSLKVRRISLSLAHEKTYAVAIVVLED